MLGDDSGTWSYAIHNSAVSSPDVPTRHGTGYASVDLACEAALDECRSARANEAERDAPGRETRSGEAEGRSREGRSFALNGQVLPCRHSWPGFAFLGSEPYRRRSDRCRSETALLAPNGHDRRDGLRDWDIVLQGRGAHLRGRVGQDRNSLRHVRSGRVHALTASYRIRFFMNANCSRRSSVSPWSNPYLKKEVNPAAHPLFKLPFGLNSDCPDCFASASENDRFLT